jgi:hypothetical protein
MKWTGREFQEHRAPAGVPESGVELRPICGVGRIKEARPLVPLLGRGWKSEIRNPKSEGNPKSEIQSQMTRLCLPNPSRKGGWV